MNWTLLAGPPDQDELVLLAGRGEQDGPSHTRLLLPLPLSTTLRV